jgi:hypothetical protein
LEGVEGNMVAPDYNTDLSDITLSEDATNWAEMTTHKGGAAPAQETDYFIQGSACVSQATGGATGIAAGMQYDNTANLNPFQTGWVILMWQIILAGNVTTPFQQGGLRVYVGHAAGNWNGWKVGGEDFGRNPYGGWHNVAVDPTHPNDYVEGTPTANQYRYICSLPNLKSAISKGSPHGVDAIRYGRATLIVSGGEAADPGTFTGMGDANDAQSARWGLFQEQAGSYLWKGLMSLGYQPEQASMPVYFNDSNKNITVDNTPKTYREFNRIEIIDATSTVNWNGINIQATSGIQLSKGQLEVVNDATFTVNGCSFTDLDTFIFKSNSTITDSTFRRCDNVQQNTATFTGCLFDSSTNASALSANSPVLITYCDFEAVDSWKDIKAPNGHHHAIAISTSGSYDFTGNTFTGFGLSGSPSAAVYNNSGGNVTLSILGGGDSPTIYNAPNGSNTDIVLSVSYTLTGVVSGSEVQIVTQDALDNGTVDPDEDLYHLENTTLDDGTGQGTTKAVYAYSYTDDLGGVDVPVYIYILKLGYEWLRIRDTLTAQNKTTPVSQKTDRVYSNP